MTCIQVARMELSAKVRVTRSDPPAPAPRRTVTLVGAGPSGQLDASDAMPTWTAKSAADSDALAGNPLTSTMTPLMPRA